MHATNEGSWMRQETCDVRESNEFHIDKIQEVFLVAFSCMQKNGLLYIS